MSSAPPSIATDPPSDAPGSPGHAFGHRAPDFQAIFDASPGSTLVLATDAPAFTIVAASDGYLAATMTARDATVGRLLFDVFSDDNPANIARNGVGNLRASLHVVLRTKAPDRMAVQRYDLQRPDGTWEERYWEPLNTPVLGPDGDVRHILHRVEDVTARERAEAGASSRRSRRPGPALSAGTSGPTRWSGTRT